MSLLFIDCETTGLDPRLHEIWEVAVFDPERDKQFEVFQRHPNLQWSEAKALQVGRYYERKAIAGSTRVGPVCVPTFKMADEALAYTLAHRLDGKTLVGIGPWFDAAFIEKFLRENNQAPSWDYGLVCARTLAIGRHMETLEVEEVEGPPWSTEGVARALGIWFGEGGAIDSEEMRHTALGDVVLAAQFYEVATGVNFNLKYELEKSAS